MISTSEGYKQAIVADARQMVLKAIVDIIDPNITYGTAESSGANQYSVMNQLHNKVFSLESNYASCETNRWVLDGSMKIQPYGERGFISESVSDDYGNFAYPQYIALKFSNVSILQSFSVYFPDAYYDGLPVDFKIELMQGGTTYYEKSYTGNTVSSIACTGFTVYNPDTIKLTVYKWSLPRRRMRIPEILPGTFEEWDGSVLANFTLKHQGDISCVKLPYGTCTLTLENADRRFEPRSKTGVFQSLAEGQNIDVSMGIKKNDGTVEYISVGRYYQHSGGWKTGDNGLTMKWTLVDIIGLLVDREYIVPETLPTTLMDWIQSFVSQLGANFANKYTVDENYEIVTVTVNSRDDIKGRKIGDLLKNICMATGTWARADAETGYLAIEPTWSQGNKLTLSNLEKYPTMSANDDIAYISFKIYDGSSNDTTYVVSGNNTATSNTVSVDNPFIHNTTQALAAAKVILIAYGGNKITTTGRGDPASEIGDVDTIWLNESQATTARRITSDLSFNNGVLKSCNSEFLQADGSFMYQNRVLITSPGTWTAPSGVTSLRLILVGGGSGGTSGTDGDWDEAGTDGTDGKGGKVWSQTISCNSGQSFSVVIGSGGNIGEDGTATTFGGYTSANGEAYPYGYTDVASAASYSRTGVYTPLDNSGDGGRGGSGGRQGNKHYETRTDSEGHSYSRRVVDNYPGIGEVGTKGASGCVVIYYDI